MQKWITKPSSIAAPPHDFNCNTRSDLERYIAISKGIYMAPDWKPNNEALFKPNSNKRSLLCVEKIWDFITNFLICFSILNILIVFSRLWPNFSLFPVFFLTHKVHHLITRMLSSSIQNKKNCTQCPLEVARHSPPSHEAIGCRDWWLLLLGPVLAPLITTLFYFT